MRELLFIFTAILTLALQGCETVNKAVYGSFIPPDYYEKEKPNQYQLNRSHYQPLAVYTTDKLPELEAYLNEDPEYISGKCLLGSAIFTFGLLAPLCVATVPLDLHTSKRTKQQRAELEIDAQSFVARLEKLADQKLLRSYAMEYLNQNRFDAKEIDIEITSSPNTNIVDDLHKQGHPVALELSLILMQYTQIEEKFCLKLEANARTIRTSDNVQIATQQAFGGKCMHMDEWLKEDALEQSVTDIYATAIEYLLNQVIFVYEDWSDNTIGLNVLNPKPILAGQDDEYKEKERELNEWIEWCNEDELNCEEEYLSHYVGFDKPKTYGALQPVVRSGPSIYGLVFTDVGIHPTFVWAEVNLPTATDIEYEIKIYNGKVFMKGTIERLTGTYPNYQIVVPDREILHRENIKTASYTVEEELEPCGWYFWTVRAKFNSQGNYRITEWSKYKDKYRTKHLYPIRTPASADNPVCWDKPVNWGAFDPSN
jgi:hypothetical protein